MERHISVVIPNYNMAATIGKCLEAVFASDYNNFEVIVVDDHSDDNSVEVIERFPCTLVRLERRSGTSRARNAGAEQSNGEFIFFIDADCLPERDTLSTINRTLSRTGPDAVVGGTYTKVPFDRSFFSTFQSVFVNYSETRNAENPDYIAAHAMVIHADTFKKNGGFPEVFLPIIEDVEFTHRLKRAGCRLVMNPDIQVRHIFNFSLVSSLRNAFKKTMYWTMYSLKNRDLLRDSGSASYELKTNVLLFAVNIVVLSLYFALKKTAILYGLPAALVLNALVNRLQFRAFHETGGALFAGMSIMYYTMLYPVPIGIGTLTGMAKYLFQSRN